MRSRARALHRGRTTARVLAFRPGHRGRTAVPIGRARGVAHDFGGELLRAGLPGGPPRRTRTRPPLRVLGPYLRNTTLHRAIREQGGAYGAGAGYGADAGTFRFFSYRDPRIAGTFADFDLAVRRRG